MQPMDHGIRDAREYDGRERQRITSAFPPVVHPFIDRIPSSTTFKWCHATTSASTVPDKPQRIPYPNRNGASVVPERGSVTCNLNHVARYGSEYI